MILEIIILTFVIIFWNEGKHDAILAKGKYNKDQRNSWHSLDVKNWILIGSIIGLVFSAYLNALDESLYILKGILLLTAIGGLRNVVMVPRQNGILGQNFFYIGSTGKYDKIVKRLGKWHWIISMGVVITSYTLIKIL